MKTNKISKNEFESCNWIYNEERSRTGETCPPNSELLYYSKKQGGFDYLLSYSPILEWLYIWINQGPVYVGNCKSFPEFKKILKLITPR